MSGSRLRPYMGPIVALLVILALGAGTVYAAIPNSNGKYYACMTKSTGAVKMINYPKVKCTSGQKLISWNAQGPAGPQGVQGAQGPAGPAGPADWNAIPNKPAGFADGVDNVGYQTETVPCNNPISATGEYVRFENLPRNMVHEFQVVPTNGVWLFVDRVEFLVPAASPGTLWADVRVDDFGDSGTGTCNIRHISYTEGISLAKAKQQLKKIEVSYPKKRSNR